MSKKIYSYSDDDIEVLYDAKKCIHAAKCVHGLPQVFNPNKKPWVMPSAASADAIARVVAECPTGALFFKRRDNGAEEATPELNSISISADGPLYVRGNIRMMSGDNEEITETRIALCRCGASANKPYCDNSHIEAGFKASGSAEVGSKADDLTPTGELTATPALNGPVLLKGNFEISTEEGNVIFSGSKAALCRCGASANKPFCDGAHVQADFNSA